MKGKLEKDNFNKWFIKEVKTVKNCFGCKSYEVFNVYELHPDDALYCLESDEGKEVSFEIVIDTRLFIEGKKDTFATLTKEEPMTFIDYNPTPNSFIFNLKNDESIIVIDEVGFKYKGELIEDSGEVYKLFKQFLEDAGK